MRRLFVVRSVTILVALTMSGFFVAIAHGTTAPAAATAAGLTIHDPFGSMSGLNMSVDPSLRVDDNLYENSGGDSDSNGIHVAFCPDGTVIHAQVSKVGHDPAGTPYWLALTGTSPVLQTPVSSTPPGPGVANPAGIIVSSATPALASGGGVFLYPNPPYYGPASISIQRWDHGLLTAAEDSQSENDLGSNDSTHPGNNDDETADGSQDPGHPDGDGARNSSDVPVTDESAWDDSVDIGDTIVQPTSPAQACSVLPRTTVALTPDTTHLSSSGWYNSQSGLTSGVQVALTTCDAAHQVAPNVDVDHLVHGLSGATTLGDTNTTVAGCTTPSATFSITAQGTTAIKYHGVDNETPAKSEIEQTTNVSIDTVAPTVTCPAPAPIFTLGQAGAQVTASVSDATSGISPSTQTSVSANAATSSVGSHSVTMPAVSDVAGNTNNSTSCSYSVIYDFSGFFPPVDNEPTLNTVRAGSAIPVKFSLHGNQGLSLFQAGYPKIAPIACPSGVPLDAVEQTVTAGSSSLGYDATSDTYTYTWKTDKAWAGQCARFSLGLIDGSSHTADFQFTR